MVEGDGRGGGGDTVDVRGGGAGFVRWGCDEDDYGEGRFVGED